jgi:O-methyltransferase
MTDQQQLLYNFDMSYKRAAVEKLAESVDYVTWAAVEGDIAEFGTHSGLTATVLAYSMTRVETLRNWHIRELNLPTRSLLLFDSFEGFPQAESDIDASSPSVLSGSWAAGKAVDKTPVQLMEMCSAHIDHRRISIHRGWFKDSLPRLSRETRFALVHIDCDLYSSTMDVLTDLFEKERFADGCVLLFDDWNCNRASPDFGERRAWVECVARYAPRFSDCGQYGPMGHQFIIHK